MAFLKKHIVWVVLAVVLAAEGAFTFVLLGKKSEVAKARTDQESKVRLLTDLQQQSRDFAKKIQVLNERKEAVRGERGDVVLFLWHRGELLDTLFRDTALATYNPAPWRTLPPDKMGTFRFDYQRAYEREVNDLEPALTKLGTTREAAGFHPSDAFTRPTVIIGDIYAAQKDFWLRSEVVRLAGKSRVAHLGSIKIDLEGKTIPGYQPPSHDERRGIRLGKLFNSIAVQIEIQCSYPVCGDFLRALAGSPIGYRIVKLNDLVRAHLDRTKAAVAPAPAARPAAAIAVVMPADEQVVTLNILCEVRDINLDIMQVKFPRSSFRGGKNDVKAWLDVTIGRLDNTLKTPLADRKRGAPSDWLAQARAQAADAAKEKDGKGVPVVISDGLLGAAPEYSFPTPREASQWLDNRADYQRVLIEARLALWRSLRSILDDKERVQEAGDVVVTFRPRDQFDQDRNKIYDQVLDPDRKVEMEFGLVTFQPEESREGLKRTGGAP